MDYNYYNGKIGNLNCEDNSVAQQKKHVIIQSMWTKPFKNRFKFRDQMFMAALSLEYAHRSGYRVHMHTDSVGYSLLRNFGYDKLCRTLVTIPSSVPTDFFAAGKFYAMKAEGIVGKVHIDTDVMLKKNVLDRFYTDKRIDVIHQMEEDMPLVHHEDKIFHMHVLGYPPTMRPTWQGSYNTGIVGFNNRELANKYFDNYFEALQMYNSNRLEEYKTQGNYDDLHFDFVLEQITLSFLSHNYNAYALLPTKMPSEAADAIGYLHLQGERKWDIDTINWIKNKLRTFNPQLYNKAEIASCRAYNMKSLPMEKLKNDISLKYLNKFVILNGEYAVNIIEKNGCSTLGYLSFCQKFPNEDFLTNGENTIHSYDYFHFNAPTCPQNEYHSKIIERCFVDIEKVKESSYKKVAIFRDPMERLLSARNPLMFVHFLNSNEDFFTFVSNEIKKPIGCTDQHIIPQAYYYDFDDIDIFVELKDLEKWLVSIGCEPMKLNQTPQGRYEDATEDIKKWLPTFNEYYKDDFELIKKIKNSGKVWTNKGQNNNK